MSVLPFDQRDGFIWKNGQLVEWKDAKLHVLSHGLHYASCVFEGERAYGGGSSSRANIRSASGIPPNCSISSIPYSVEETRRRQGAGRGEERL